MFEVLYHKNCIKVFANFYLTVTFTFGDMVKYTKSCSIIRRTNMKRNLIVIAMISLLLVHGSILSMNVEASAVRDDSVYIQNLIDTAVAGSDGVKVVTVPSVNPNDPEGGSVYTLSNAIELPSNTTVKLDNCTLRLNDGFLCNIFISKGCYNTSVTAEQELENISIIGIGNAVLDGGKHNGVTEKTATKEEGFSSVRYNTSIYFRNVNGYCGGARKPG